jgi:hypothetical protein
MRDIQILKQHPKKVLDNLKLGEVDSIEYAVDQITDEFMIYGLRGGLIDELSKSFPDPRKECEITVKQILCASIAGHFQDMYAMSQSPYALHSPILLAELGLNVKVLVEGEGISRRGTQENAPFNGDVIRKMLCEMEPSSLVDWYNRYVGRAYLRQADYSPCIHILDCTKLVVNWENEKYEGSGVVTNDEGEQERGYKLGSLRSLLDDGGIITSIAFGPIQVHDLTLCQDILLKSPHLKPKDLLIVDRAYIDGEDISILKLRRKVDTILPLRSDMKAYEDAIVSAYYHDGTTKDQSWEQHPTREHQQIKRIEHLDYLWDECSVPMIGCVVRELKEGRDGSGGRDDYEHMVFGTTRLRLTGSQMIRTYELRPEIEEDHRQWKDGPWDMTEFTSTSLVQIVYHVICVLLAYNLSKVYSNTRAGQDFARKTLRQLTREQARNHKVAVLVFVDSYYAVFDIRFFTGILLRLPQEAVVHLRNHFPIPELGFT